MKDENERRVVQERVVQTPQGAAATVVDQRTSVMPTPAERAMGTLVRAQQVVWLLVAILSGLIAIRTILIALGADMKLGFGMLVYSVTQPFDLPFLMLFGEQATAASRTPTIEFGSLVAIPVYVLLGWVICKVFDLMLAPRATRALASQARTNGQRRRGRQELLQGHTRPAGIVRHSAEARGEPMNAAVTTPGRGPTMAVGTPVDARDGRIGAVRTGRCRISAAGVIALLCIVIAGCGEPAGTPTQSVAPPTPTAVAEELAGSSPLSAAEVAAGVQATAVSQAVVARAQASAATLRVYRTKAGVALQEYANALGTLREKDREVGERPALIADTEWLGRTTTAMHLMQAAADRLTAIEPVPPEMAVTAALIRQIEGETRLLNREYGLGIESAASAAIAAAGRRTTPMLALVGQANIELRRGPA
ncbi:MAG: hypothetical protein HY332_06470 [Chloroflexi bacterium]|nr:hypothetical protein [Chloroflexota bacterium]